MCIFLKLQFENIIAILINDKESQPGWSVMWFRYTQGKVVLRREIWASLHDAQMDHKQVRMSVVTFLADLYLTELSLENSLL